MSAAKRPQDIAPYYVGPFTQRIREAVAASARPRAATTKSGKAQIITPEQLDHLLRHIQATSQFPLRDYAIMLLSYKAGLRAGEIAGLSWRDVTDAMGKVGKPRRNNVTGAIELYIEIPRGIAKYGSARSIPLHAALQATLEHLQAEAAAGPHDAVIRGCKTPRLTPNALVQFIRSVYEAAGLRGCTSHSGRRTAITQLARTANTHGCSLRDVQLFAGHANLGTTEVYLDASPFAGKLVRSL